ncbi:MAG: hypothetical protein J3K34DRAFT_419758 [Monoraphidium minutum]|nr:MAG: hypothetical protein J3K34DRAFT_419758 [Monoraphidium minutum]
MPAPFTNKNLINVWDCGRLMQQSYYGCDDASCWAARPWRWNPVQCGSWQNRPARLLSSAVEGAPPARVLTSALPRNWGGQQLLEDVIMTSDYRMAADHLAAAYSMAYNGASPQPLRTQETPAFFADRRLSVLAFYEGPAPWSDGGLRFTMPGGTNNYFTPTERCGRDGPRSPHVLRRAGARHARRARVLCFADTPTNRPTTTTNPPPRPAAGGPRTSSPLAALASASTCPPPPASSRTASAPTPAAASATRRTLRSRRASR